MAPRFAARSGFLGVFIVTTSTVRCFAVESLGQPTTSTQSPSTETASSDAPNPESPPDDKADSRHHFHSGVNLYEDRNFTAALAEFEAAYRQYPSASALQNVALCQKQLYRYSEARESLMRLVRAHLIELNDAERVAVDEAIRELGSLIGSIRLSVVPADAKIWLDGRNLTPEDLSQPIVLDVGEHRVTAEAPGFAALSRGFRIAGGHTLVPVALTLTETTGTVVVTAPNAQTAIAVDGRPVAFAEWSGRLEPGRHIVQVYREGYEPFEEEIDVEIGATTHVRGVLGERTDPIDRAEQTTELSGKNRRLQQGYYGLVGASLLVPNGHPTGFDADSNHDLGWSFGLRAGYRLLPPFGIEAAVDASSFSVGGHCANPSASACPMVGQTSYQVDARRFGAAIRLFSSNDTLRLTSVFGGGMVSHDFHDSTHKAAGLDPYVLLEAGVQGNWRHGLWELVAIAVFDGASNIHVGDYHPYAEASGIQMFGLGLRIGWSEWMPSRAPLPPMPTQKATQAQ
jgi:hypothetical protein